MTIRYDCEEVKSMATEIVEILNDGYAKGYLTGIDIKLIQGLWADIADIAVQNRADSGIE